MMAHSELLALQAASSPSYSVSISGRSSRGRHGGAGTSPTTSSPLIERRGFESRSRVPDLAPARLRSCRSESCDQGHDAELTGYERRDEL